MVTEVVLHGRTVEDKEFTASMVINRNLKEVIMVNNHLIIMDHANQHHNQLIIMDHLHNEYQHQISVLVNNNNLAIEEL